MQQCVEKYLKALLTSLEITFPKIHDLGELIHLLPPENRPSLSIPDQERLTDYAAAARYPDDVEPMDRNEAEEAVQLAQISKGEIGGHIADLDVDR